MRAKSLFVIALLAIGCVAAVLLGATPASRSANVRWEYKFILASSGNPELARANNIPTARELGEDGWELVTVTLNGGESLWLSYKRPK